MERELDQLEKAQELQLLRGGYGWQSVCSSLLLLLLLEFWFCDLCHYILNSTSFPHPPQKKVLSINQARGALDVILPHFTLLPFPNFPPNSFLPHKSVKLLQSFAWMERKKKTKLQTKIVKRFGFLEKKKLGFCLWYMHAQRRGLRDVTFRFLPPSPPPHSPLPNPSSMNLQWWTHNKTLRRRLMILKKPKLLSLQTPNQMQKRKKKEREKKKKVCCRTKTNAN